METGGRSATQGPSWTLAVLPKTRGYVWLPKGDFKKRGADQLSAR